MTDGFFNSVANQFFGELYGTGTDPFTCLMINPSGNIERCTSANVLCEKKLIKDNLMCLDKTNLTGLIVYNASSEITIPLRFTASMCIEYCRGNESSYQVIYLSTANPNNVFLKRCDGKAELSGLKCPGFKP